MGAFEAPAGLLGPIEGPWQPGLELKRSRIVDEGADSITVRGAKCHTSFSANADELIVLPTRAMGPKDRDYAVAFVIPIDYPGLTLYVSPYSGGTRSETRSIIPSRRVTSFWRASRSSTMCEFPRSGCSSIESRSGPGR
jgi:hypothetical protein